MKIAIIITLLLQCFFTYGQNSVNTDYILIHDIRPERDKSVSSILISKDITSDDYEVLEFKVKEKTLLEILNYISLFKTNTLPKASSKSTRYNWQVFEIIYYRKNKIYKKIIYENEYNLFLRNISIINNENSEKNNLSEYLDYARQLVALP